MAPILAALALLVASGALDGVMPDLAARLKELPARAWEAAKETAERVWGEVRAGGAPAVKWIVLGLLGLSLLKSAVLRGGLARLALVNPWVTLAVIVGGVVGLANGWFGGSGGGDGGGGGGLERYCASRGGVQLSLGGGMQGVCGDGSVYPPSAAFGGSVFV